MPSGNVGCDVSGIGLVLPGGRGKGTCRMADAADLLTSQGDVGSGSAAEGARAGTGETTPPSSGMVPLAGDVTSLKGGEVASSPRLNGRCRAPEMSPPPPPPQPQPPPPSKREGFIDGIAREVATPLNQVLPDDDARGLRPGGRDHAGKRRVCSLQGVETTLQGLLESMEGGLRVDAASLGVNGMFCADADNIGRTKHGFCYGMSTTGTPPPSSPSANTRNPPVGQRTQGERRQQSAPPLRSHLSDAAGVGKAHAMEHALSISGKRDAGVATNSDRVHPAAGAGGFDCDGHHQSARRDRDGSFEARRTRGDRQRREWENKDGDREEEEAVAGRVIELSRGIALRCLHLEQECLRRGRTQERLFQEQLRGVRQVTAIVPNGSTLSYVAILPVIE